jgi:thymidine kinase
MNNLNHGSYLKLIIGPMFSSKSSTLLSEIHRLLNITDRILVINNILDKQRYSDMNIDGQGIGLMKTHDNKSFPALMLAELNELNTNYNYNMQYQLADIIIIDEGQFYKDLFIFIQEQLFNQYNNKYFIIAGLSSDFNMQPIGDIIKLIPMTNEIIQLSALCAYCKDGTIANFTKLIKPENEDNNIIIGNKNLYSPCCRKHYLL